MTAAAATVTVAAAAVAAALLLQRASGPTVADAAALAAKRPAPAMAGRLLRAGVQRVAFPNWGPELGWHSTGARNDRLDGRPTRTVLYEHTVHRIAYTTFSGRAL